MSQLAGNSKPTADAYRSVLEGMYPFMEKTKGIEDKDLKEKMQAEVAKGPIYFTPIENKTQKAPQQKVELPEDFKKKLQNRTRKK